MTSPSILARIQRAALTVQKSPAPGGKSPLSWDDPCATMGTLFVRLD